MSFLYDYCSWLTGGEENCFAFRGRSAEPPQLRFRGLGTHVLPQESTQYPSPPQPYLVFISVYSKKLRLRKLERKVLDSWGKCVKVETPQGIARGGSTRAPRKASTWSVNQLLLALSIPTKLPKQPKTITV